MIIRGCWSVERLQIECDQFEIEGDDAHHLPQPLRLHPPPLLLLLVLVLL